MQHILGLLSNPHQEWSRIRDEKQSIAGQYLRFLIWIAIIPPVVWNLANWMGARRKNYPPHFGLRRANHGPILHCHPS